MTDDGLPLATSQRALKHLSPTSFFAPYLHIYASTDSLRSLRSVFTNGCCPEEDNPGKQVSDEEARSTPYYYSGHINPFFQILLIGSVTNVPGASRRIGRDYERICAETHGESRIIMVGRVNGKTGMGQRNNDYQRQWIEGSRDDYLEALYDLEEGGDVAMCRCGVGALWRCLDCLPPLSFCARCLRLEHLAHPLHRVEYWTGSHYESAWLRSVHVQIHLGHRGLPCPDRDAYGQDTGDTRAPSSPVFTFQARPSGPSAIEDSIHLLRPMVRPRRVRETLVPSSHHRILPDLPLPLRRLRSVSGQPSSQISTPATTSPDTRSSLSSPGLPPSSPWSEEPTFTHSRSITPDLPLSSEQRASEAPDSADDSSPLLHVASSTRGTEESRGPSCQPANPSPGLLLSGLSLCASDGRVNISTDATQPRNEPQPTVHLGKHQRTGEIQGRRVRPCIPIGLGDAGTHDQPEELDDDEPEEVPPEEDDEYSESPYVYDEVDGATMPRIGEEVLRPRPSMPDGRPLVAVRMMIIVDVSGVHELPVTICHCAHAERVDKQLLRMGLYPATQRQPRTAFTFKVLDDFLLTNKECKTSAMNYYNKLRRVTNDSFPHMVPVSVTLPIPCLPLTPFHRTVIGTYCVFLDNGET